jgi:hypothetical protein
LFRERENPLAERLAELQSNAMAGGALFTCRRGVERSTIFSTGSACFPEGKGGCTTIRKQNWRRLAFVSGALAVYSLSQIAFLLTLVSMAVYFEWDADFAGKTRRDRPGDFARLSASQQVLRWLVRRYRRKCSPSAISIANS